MSLEIMAYIGIGSSFAFSMMGSVVGALIAGSAVIGAWKKCFIQNKPAPFIMVAFAGCPLTNIIYGFILMGQLAISDVNSFMLMFMGIAAGIGIGASSYVQARCAACAAEAYAETGQGFGNYIMVIGICETISLFAMVFTMLAA